MLKRTDPIPGKDITLSLDLDLQEAAEEALGGRRGAIVALLPDTGEVVAMVSQPSFNPNLFVTGISFKDYGELRDSIDRPLYNRVLRGLYPPGSTIKPMMAVAGLDAGVITPTSRVFDRASSSCPTCSTSTATGIAAATAGSISTAIARSNDTYFYDMAHKLGVDRMYDYMTRFGLGQRVSLDMYEETAGLMPSRDWKRARYRQPWYPGETVILGIGQGYMQATPLQLAQATALMATRGKWIRPHRRAASVASRRWIRAAAGYPAARSALLGLRDPRHGAGTARRRVRRGRSAKARSIASPARAVLRRSWRSARARNTTVPSWPSAIATMPCLLPLPRCMTRRSRWR